MALGIDQQIESRKDAYRGNPQQLQKRYSQNKELVDLLALQQMKSDQEAVKRNQALSAEQNAGTVAEKLEAEVLNGYKQNLAGKVKDTRGVLQTKQANQQRNMGRMAAAAAQSKPTGLAGLTGAAGQAGLGGMRRPPIQGTQGIPSQVPTRMAAGGIVGYATGTLITLTPEQKARAEQLFGANAESYIARLEGMTEENAAAAALLNPLNSEAGSSAGSPFGRFVGRIGQSLSDTNERSNLLTQLESKYGGFAGQGALRIFNQQSEAEMAYADKVLDSMGGLNNDQLRELIDAPFLGGGETDFSLLPDLPEPGETSETSEDTAEQPVPEDGAETFDPNELPEGDGVTFLPVEREPSAFEGIDTEIEAVVPEQVDTTAVDTAQADMLAGAGDTVSSLNAITMDDPDATQVAGLQAVSPDEYLDATDQKLLEGVTKQNVSMVNKNQDPLAMGLDARDESDDYLLRKAKQDTRARQIDRQQALENEYRGNDRMNNMIATLGGARRGSGGLSDAYLAAQDKTRKRRTKSELDRRGIEDAAILTDTDIGKEGQLMQRQIGQQSQDLLGKGLAGIQSRLDTSATMAEGVRAGKQSAFNVDSRNQTAVDIRNNEAENNTQQQNAVIEQAGLDNLADARLAKLQSLDKRAFAEQARLTQGSANEQKALSDSVNASLESARGQDAYDKAVEEFNRKNMSEMEALYTAQVVRLEADRNEMLAGDVNYAALQNDLAKAIRDGDVSGKKAAEEAVDAWESNIDRQLALQFGLSYALLGAMKTRLDALRAQAGMPTQAPVNPSNPGVTVTPVP